MPKDRLVTFFSEYKKAFEQFDGKKISEYFFYPCIIEQAGVPVTAFNTPEELKKFEQSALDYFASIQLKKADFEILTFQVFDGGNIFCGVKYDLFGQGDILLGKINWVYHLLDKNSTLKILTAHFVP